MKEEKKMKMQEPKVEFVPIDMNEVITANSKCRDEAQKASMTVCDCTDDEEGQLPGCVGDIV